MAIMIPIFWLVMLIYGLMLLRTSTKRKLGTTLITLFFFPVILYLILTVIFQIFFGLSFVDLYRIGCGMNAVHYTECYPQGYFPE
jgi:hypothetical protein